MDDQRIVELYLQRDEAAIGQTAGKFGQRLRSLAYGIVRDRQTAEECENDTYLEAWNTIPPHQPGGYLYAYLARITRHLALNCCRDRTRLKRNACLCQLSEELEQCIPAFEDTERHIDAMLLQEALNGFLAGLPETKRNVFVRRYWYLDSLAEIAGRYSLSQSMVKIILYRCRIQLREHLERKGYTV